MKILKFLYYVSVVTLSLFAACFSYAVDVSALWYVTPMVVFLMILPYVHKKVQSKQTVQSEINIKGIIRKEKAENESEKNDVTETENSALQEQDNDFEKYECENPCEDEASCEKVDEIGISYEDSEPEEEETSRKEYIFMGIRAYSKHGISLSSERFESKTEAEYFAEVFRHNYTARMRVFEAKGGGYGVFADFVPEYLIQSNYRREDDGYIFANWKYEHRKNLPEPPKEHFVDKYPKIADAMVFGIITLPLFAVILLVEWLRGAAIIPPDSSAVKVSAHELSEMSGTDFENYAARRLKSMGYKNVKVTQASGDFGADVLAFNTKGEYVCIQCKHYIKPVGIKAVQEIYSAKQYYKCQKAMVITNSTFTQAAIDLANKTGVDLWPNFR